jgi:hypothetical protein
MKKTFSKNGYDYKLLKSSERIGNQQVAIYEQLDKDQDMKCVAYEVRIIRFILIKKDKPRYNLKAGDEEIRHPSNEDWGNYGWTYRDLEKAKQKYDETVSYIATQASE